MGTSTIQIYPDSLAEIVGVLKQFDIRVVRSVDDEFGVRVMIEGQSVPDSPAVIGTIAKSHGDRSSTLTLTFEEC